MRVEIEKNCSVIFRELYFDIRGECYGLSEGKSGKFIDFADDYKTVIILSQYGDIKRIPAENVRFLETE